jgi:hypothetical protein
LELLGKRLPVEYKRWIGRAGIDVGYEFEDVLGALMLAPSPPEPILFARRMLWTSSQWTSSRLRSVTISYLLLKSSIQWQVVHPLLNFNERMSCYAYFFALATLS